MQKSKIVIPLHYNKGESYKYQKIMNRANFITETDTEGTVKVLKSKDYKELNEVLEITATSINQSSKPETVAENLICYLQNKYNLA